MWWRKQKQETVPAPKPLFDCEFDLENNNVLSIERDEDDPERTTFYFRNAAEWWLRCSVEKHQEFLARFRAKIARELAASLTKPKDEEKK